MTDSSLYQHDFTFEVLLKEQSEEHRQNVCVICLLFVFSLDTTLIDFTDMKCQRGDLSFIFNGDALPSESFVVLDNEQKVYQRIHHEVSDMHVYLVSAAVCFMDVFI